MAKSAFEDQLVAAMKASKRLGRQMGRLPAASAGATEVGAGSKEETLKTTADLERAGVLF